jgi:hypothetical protein
MWRDGKKETEGETDDRLREER